MKPVAPTTWGEKKAYRREKARNIQVQLKPTPVMTPSAIRDQGVRRWLDLLAPPSPIMPTELSASKATVPATKNDKAPNAFLPDRTRERNAMKPHDAPITAIPRKTGLQKPAVVPMLSFSIPAVRLARRWSFASVAYMQGAYNLRIASTYSSQRFPTGRWTPRYRWDKPERIKIREILCPTGSQAVSFFALYSHLYAVPVRGRCKFFQSLLIFAKVLFRFLAHHSE